MRLLPLFAIATLVCLPAFAVPVDVDLEALRDEMAAAELPPPQRHLVSCTDGMAGAFPCDRVDLYEVLSLADLGGAANANDIWGWTDSSTGAEYAVVGLSSGTSFVDITDPENAVHLGNLATHTSTSLWRDVKVYDDHAYVVSEAGGHGMQVFDLTQLRDVTAPPETFTATAHYDEFGSAHNIVINEDSGFAYAVGTDDCGGGLHMIDLSSPTSPTFAGCFSDDGYTHDAQCVIYAGPDAEHVGSEICFNSNTDTLTIVDVTDKATPRQLSRTSYAQVGYTHQGWLTEDHAYFLLDDELDESNFGNNTRTLIWDLADLDAPAVIGSYLAPTGATDHNLYVHNGWAFQGNYRAGLRILDLSDVAAGNLTEFAFFDVVPANDSPGFGSGLWSVYPYFESGTVIASAVQQGLFIFRPQLCTAPDTPADLTAIPASDNAIELDWTATPPAGGGFNLYRALGTCPASGELELVASGLGAGPYVDSVSGQVDYAYVLTAVEESGFCESPPSPCATTSTTGACTAPPIFAGVTGAANQAEAACAVEVTWDAATPSCGTGTTYSVYRSTDPGFVPAAANRVVSGLGGTSWVDTTVESGIAYAYAVRATDDGSGSEDTNDEIAVATPTGPISNGSFAVGAEIGDAGLLFENGTSPTSGGGGGFGAKHLGWHLSDARANTGERSYFSTYQDDLCVAIVTPPLTLTAGGASTLSFWSVFDIEDSWDGGVLQISDDGGTSYATLTPDQGYPGSFNTGSDGCGFSDGDSSFTGTDLTWSEYTADLDAWQGQEIRLRWLFSTDGVVNQEGWYVDDITLTDTQVPGTCAGGSGLIFLDGFEGGDTSAWQ